MFSTSILYYPNRNVILYFSYFQHGSYPLVTPLNETFPPDFYLNRTDAFHVKIKQDTDAVSYVMPMPRPGRWYFAAFLPKTSDSIQQKVAFEKKSPTFFSSDFKTLPWKYL